MKTPIDPQENPLGKTYWEYYRRNYLPVPIVTTIIAAVAVWDLIQGAGTWTSIVIIGGMLVINGIVFGLSYYQYQKRI